MKKLSLSLGLLSLLALGACAEDPAPPPRALVLPPRISLDVHSVGLVDNTIPAPHGITQLPTDYKPSINDAIRQWAVDRLSATGVDGEAVLTVREATLTMEAIPTVTDMTSVFRRQQDTKYVAHVVVDLSAKRQGEFASATAEASRWVTVVEKPTEEERKAAYFSLLNSLMRDLGQNLETNMHQHMQSFVASGN